MCESIDSSSYSLLEQEIIQIADSPVEKDTGKPNRAETGNHAPGFPAEIPSDVTRFPLHQQENSYGNR